MNDILKELNELDIKINNFENIYKIIKQDYEDLKKDETLKKILITGTGIGLLHFLKEKIENKKTKYTENKVQINNEIIKKKNNLINFIKNMKPSDFSEKNIDIDKKKDELINQVKDAIEILKENQKTNEIKECPQFKEIVMKQKKNLKSREKIKNLNELKTIIKLKKKYNKLLNKEYSEILHKINNKNKKLLNKIKNFKK